MRTVTRLFAVLGIGFLFAVASTAVVAQDPPQMERDHYKIYDLLGDPNISGEVELRDQFGGGPVLFEGPYHFGLPTSKNDEPVFDFITHYNWYKIDTVEGGREVVYQNQFGENVVHVTRGRYLLTPALKFPDATQEPPRDRDHFKCYEALGEPLGITVRLETQFGFEDVILEEPELWCNPAEKVLPTGEIFPILNERDHLICYRIEPQQPLGISISYLDQFSPGGGHLEMNRWLCVPSLKTGVTQAEPSSWGRLKSIYR
jgi:hypothetical protein